ncbi:MAG: hypothetical protein MMC23_000499 [Stictis urceolatum]|nr:hypothetical protein [Stictis urceolata]
MDTEIYCFDDFLVGDNFNYDLSPISAEDFLSSSNSSNNGEEHASPATEFSSTSPPKLELDLDGFTPSAPTFSTESNFKYNSTTNEAAQNYLACKSPSHCTSGVIAPGKTVTAPILPMQQSQQQHFQDHFSQTPATRHVLTIKPPRLHSRRASKAAVAPSPTMASEVDSLIDPALTSIHEPPSAVSTYSTTFTQQPSQLASATEAPSTASTRTTKSSRAAQSQGEESSPADGSKPAAPKRKRARKTALSTSADAEKQARFLERNRNAASRCRARRKAQNDKLEQRAGELERERDGLRLLYQSLLSEKAELLGRVLELGCDDACSGREGFGALGPGSCAGKPPRDLLVNALGELAMRARDQESDEGQMEGLEQETAAA